MCNPPGSASITQSGSRTRDAGALPRRLKPSVSRLFMMTRSGRTREHSDGWQDKKDCFTDITASRCSTETHLADVPFPRSFNSRLDAEVKLAVHVWKVSLDVVKKKGTKIAVLSRVAKLRSVVALLHGWTKWPPHCDRTPQRLRN